MSAEERKETGSLKAIFEKYISEILVIFIGITISFFFDEWRENRKDQETIKKHLAFLRSNLVEDTLRLNVMIHHGRELVNSIDKLTYFRADSELTDSLDFHIDNAASYLVFKPNQMAYEEIRQTAHTDLIRNDSLKKLFLTYYTSTIPNCEEWCKVDESHTMTQVIPEMSIYFPVVTDSLNRVSPREKIEAIKRKKVRNLLLTNAVYKKAAIRMSTLTKQVTTRLLQKVDRELNE